MAKKADHAPSPTDIAAWEGKVARAVIGRSRLAGGGNAIVEDISTIAALLACLRAADGATDIAECKPCGAPRCEPAIEIQLYGPGGDQDRIALVSVANKLLLVGVDARADNALENYSSFLLPDAARDALRLAVEQHVVFA